MSSRRALGTLTGSTGGAFQVVQSAPGDATPQSDLNWNDPIIQPHSSGQFVAVAERCVAWTGTVLAILFVASFVLMSQYWYSWIGAEGKVRLFVVAVMQQVIATSYVVLLIGGVLMLLRVRVGRFIVIVWANLVLLMNIGGIVLYDALYLWWLANDPGRFQPQPLPVVMASIEYTRLQSASFAIIALSLLTLRSRSLR
jgi:hypothetical protein